MSINNNYDAAVTIQNWWRKLTPIAQQYIKIKKIKDATSEELALGIMDAQINTCLGFKHHESLKLLANALFGGRDKDYSAGNIRNGLTYLLYDRQSSLKDIAQLINHLLQIEKPVWSDLAEINDKEKKKLTEEQKTVCEEKSWAAKIGKNEDEIVHISHGGGLVYIRLFLTGRIEGYPKNKEYLGKGIFVTPNQDADFSNARNTTYAVRHLDNWDTPAFFEADIPAGKLGAVRNDYEAVLRSSNIKYLKNISIALCPLSTQEIFNRGLPIYSMKELPVDKNLIDRIEQSRIRLSETT